MAAPGTLDRIAVPSCGTRGRERTVPPARRLYPRDGRAVTAFATIKGAAEALPALETVPVEHLYAYAAALAVLLFGVRLLHRRDPMSTIGPSCSKLKCDAFQRSAAGRPKSPS